MGTNNPIKFTRIYLVGHVSIRVHVKFSRPVASVLTEGERVWLDKLATKFDCCANPGIDIDIKDRTKMPSDIIEVYLPTGNFINCFIFVDIHI